MARTLDVWMNGEHVGEWTLVRGVDQLSYDARWLSSPNVRPLSLSLPLKPGGEAYRGPVVRNFFDNLLPDNEVIRERLQVRFNAASTSAFDLLWEIGRDCIGAIQLVPAGDAAPAVRSVEARPLSRAEVGRILRAVPLSGRQAELEDFRLSLAGAQEKTALLWNARRWWAPYGATPSTHILKLPIGVAASGLDLRASVENEWLCAQVLRALEVPVAQCTIEQFDGVRALCVERFDRRWADDRSWIIRLPQEDLAQATAVSAGRKYESDGGPGVRQILELLRQSSAADSDRRDFFRTQVVFWLLCAVDGHAKNFSIHLEAGGSFRLTPRYDVMSAYPMLGRGAAALSARSVKMSMAVWGDNRHYPWSEIRRHHFERTARDCGLGEVGSAAIDELVSQVPVAMERVRDQLPRGFPSAVAEPILAGLKAATRRLGVSRQRG